jgi:hypothetical protein
MAWAGAGGVDIGFSFSFIACLLGLGIWGILLVGGVLCLGMGIGNGRPVRPGWGQRSAHRGMQHGS